MSKAPNLKHQAIRQRSRARRQLLQILYQWQMSGDNPDMVKQNCIIAPQNRDIDEDYFNDAYQVITASVNTLEEKYAQFMVRKISTLDPIERAILWIGAYELTYRPDIHPTIVINEAIELAKQFGGEDGYKFINGILDKLAKSQG